MLSPHSHESQDLSSIQSLSISSRTSVSSFGEQQPDQNISEIGAVHKIGVERFKQTLPFLKLRAYCEDEILRFNSFAMDQHIALPLILGRNHLYNQDRMRIRLSDLQKEVSLKIDLL